jgi:hypothetical protein
MDSYCTALLVSDMLRAQINAEMLEDDNMAWGKPSPSTENAQSDPFKR